MSIMRTSKITTGLSAIATASVLSVAAMSTQAAGLNELFGNNSASKAKFLSVDEAFDVLTDTKASAKGTRLSITFDITPGHYVYKDQLKVRFPKGISATPFTYSQKPVTIDDPTFGKVPVFKQRTVVATTTLATKNGKGAKNAPILIDWQGCATAGLCYPPEKVKTKINIPATR
ncbi:protein-disulfide reductase DsbD N-terminal domain-containing protein [Psychrobacter sp. 1Y11]|uniref:protein-disulfide reductase DsbD N-terminal domain-containing protein n=1 Tax=Psychrobacter sp. 1Y11 TaxID=3457446 RepID=UPI003FCF772A